jgi:hypothetical protein
LTRYHYRLVAQNASGMTVGGDRTFRTLPQPRGLTLAGTPNPVPAGGATTLGGAMTGSGDIAGRQVLLQANPYPYTQGFVTVSNILLTNPDGSFAFPVLSVQVNTQYRVLMPQRPDVVSPTVVLGTTVTVTRKVRVTRFRRSGRLRFTGRITPAIDGHQVLIQKLGPKGFYTIGRTFARDNGDSSSRYVKRVRQRRGGRYRVVANINAQHVPSGSRSKLIRRVRRR